ncbi:MAG: hypothetical protein R3B45_01080 [Bdellovibrionota bacterium]
MPLIEINALPQDKKVNISNIVTCMTAKISEVLDIPRQAIYCTWNTLETDCYAHGEHLKNLQPENSHPPIVNLTMYEGRSPDLIEKTITAIAEELKIGLNQKDFNAFITYHEAKSGTIFVGGRIK